MRQKHKQPTTNQVAKLSKKRNPTKDGTFSDHIVELRRRLMFIALAFVSASALTYTYHDVLVKIIMSPLNGEKLVYLTPGGGFSFIFQVSIYAGLIISAPFIVHHLYAFIRPALPDRARRSAGRVVLSAVALIIMGISYGYFVAVPAALHFLSGFAGDSVTPNLTADSYLSFFLSYIAGLALLSLLPLLLIFWHWVKPLTPSKLIKSERWVILFAFVVAAIITPTPDAANQTMIAAPVILLYQFGVAAVFVSVTRSKFAARRAGRHAIDMETDEDKLNELLAEEWPTAIATDTSIQTAFETQLQQPQTSFAASITASEVPTTPRPTTSSVHHIYTGSEQLKPAALTYPPSRAQRPARRSMDIIGRAQRPTVQQTTRTNHYTNSQQPAQPVQQRRQITIDGIFTPMPTNAATIS
jgi:sec-independent protein translocase protein TatC